MRQYKISCNVSTVHISENIQSKIYNLQIRLEQFTDRKKKLELNFHNTINPQT